MSRFSNTRHRQNSGDTIVEVLLVLAVLGFAISISYATATRSLMDARRAQENSQASAFLQSQAEALRSMAAITGPGSIFSQPGAFCVNDTVPVFTAVAATNGVCTKNGLYHLSITYDTPLYPDGFELKALWDDVQGQGQNSVTLAYRLYSPL
jgi:type II secretory pathway pseudopilin PulG